MMNYPSQKNCKSYKKDLLKCLLIQKSKNAEKLPNQILPKLQSLSHLHQIGALSYREKQKANNKNLINEKTIKYILKKPKSKYAIIAIYQFKPKIFKYLKKVKNESDQQNQLTNAFNLALKNGSLGGKILGAGGGGFLLFYVNKNKIKQFIHSFKKLIKIDFQFENDGVKIIYNDFLD